jgi:hypothetical protein
VIGFCRSLTLMPTYAHLVQPTHSLLAGLPRVPAIIEASIHSHMNIHIHVHQNKNMDMSMNVECRRSQAETFSLPPICSVDADKCTRPCSCEYQNSLLFPLTLFPCLQASTLRHATIVLIRGGAPCHDHRRIYTNSPRDPCQGYLPEHSYAGEV